VVGTTGALRYTTSTDMTPSWLGFAGVIDEGRRIVPSRCARWWLSGVENASVARGGSHRGPTIRSASLVVKSRGSSSCLTWISGAPILRAMGFFTRMLVPRSVRRATHPGRAVKRAVTPKSIKRAKRALHPVDNAIYGVERSLNTKRRQSGRAAVYRHGSCPVKHRTPEAAARCRNP
jgi:hypothetical protein